MQSSRVDFLQMLMFGSSEPKNVWPDSLHNSQQDALSHELKHKLGPTQSYERVLE